MDEERLSKKDKKNIGIAAAVLIIVFIVLFHVLYLPMQKELALYEIAEAGSSSDYDEYLSQYPEGKYASSVKRMKERKEKSEIQQYIDEFMKDDYTRHIYSGSNLSVEIAREFGKYKGGTLIIHKVTSLSVEVAQELAKYKGWLRLSGLNEVSVEVARELAKPIRMQLSLNGLTKLTADVARELAKFKGWLQLNGLTSISVKVAYELAKHKGNLGLYGLTEISVDVASELAKHEGTIYVKSDIEKEIAKYK